MNRDDLSEILDQIRQLSQVCNDPTITTADIFTIRRALAELDAALEDFLLSLAGEGGTY